MLSAFHTFVKVDPPASTGLLLRWMKFNGLLSFHFVNHAMPVDVFYMRGGESVLLFTCQHLSFGYQ